MTSISEAFDDVLPKGWANMFAPKDRSNKSEEEFEREEQREREELLLATFGFPFSELRPLYANPAIRTKDGSMHYIRNNGEKYRFMYIFNPKIWVRE